MKLVVVNSTGPMGSSVVAAIVEKFNYINIPVRKLGVDEILTGENSLHDGMLEKKIKDVVNSASTEVKTGGVNMIDKISTPARRLIDKSVFTENFLNTSEFKRADLSSIYNAFKNSYNNSLIYKPIDTASCGRHIELTTDFYKYTNKDIVGLYQKAFTNVHFVNMHRNFVDWIESIASQRFTNPKKRFLFVLHWEYRRYSEYEKNIRECPGLHLEFEELFADDIAPLLDKIALGIEEKLPSIQWKDEKYDLYGSPRAYSNTFVQADRPGKYFSSITRFLISYFSKKDKINYFHDGVVYLFYTIDMLIFYFSGLVKK